MTCCRTACCTQGALQHQGRIVFLLSQPETLGEKNARIKGEKTLKTACGVPRHAELEPAAPMGAGKAGHKLLKNDAEKGIRESREPAAASGSVTATGARVPHAHTASSPRLLASVLHVAF